MANVHAIHSVGESLATYLNHSYERDPLHTQYPCQFRLDSSGELLATVAADYGTTNTSRLSLFLYRVTVNEHIRNTSQANGFANANIPLALDLHYLLTVWANNAAAEQTILAWTMRQFYLHPILDISSLRLDGGWTPGDFIQLIPAELSNEDVMRIWDALEPAYRLSVSYIARTIRIDADRDEDALPVVATRFSWSESDRGGKP